MRCRVSVLATAVLFAATVAAPGAATHEINIAKCAALPDDEIRLACYDGVVAAARSDPKKRGGSFWGDPPPKEGPSEEARASKGILNVIMRRCRREMQAYGSVMVKACVDQDVEAHRALLDYPAEHLSVVARCSGQMAQYGWSMVKACADQDIEAERALRGMRAR